MSNYVKPQRDNVGIVFTEMLLRHALKDMVIALGKGAYADGSREEPIIQQFRGISEEDIKGCFTVLQRKPPRLTFAFPTDTVMLPAIVIQIEDSHEHSVVLHDDADSVEYDVTEHTDTVTLKPQSGAVVGETVYRFPWRNIDANSIKETVYIRRGGADYPLSWLYDEFTIDGEKGEITLTTPTILNDSVICTSLLYYGLPGGDVSISFQLVNHVIFVDTINPIVTNFLVGLVWRELMAQRLMLVNNGLDDIRLSRRSMSLWDTVKPSMGFRSEIVVQGKTEWTAYYRQESGKYIYTSLTDEAGNTLLDEHGPESLVVE